MKLKYLSITAFVLSFLWTGALAQKATDPDALNRQVRALVQESKFDEAIQVAEKVVKIEKSRDPQSQMYAVALTDLGCFKRSTMTG
jgi:Flp pilus assembly protein TadD